MGTERSNGFDRPDIYARLTPEGREAVMNAMNANRPLKKELQASHFEALLEPLDEGEWLVKRDQALRRILRTLAEMVSSIDADSRAEAAFAALSVKPSAGGRPPEKRDSDSVRLMVLEYVHRLASKREAPLTAELIRDCVFTEVVEDDERRLRRRFEREFDSIFVQHFYDRPHHDDLLPWDVIEVLERIQEFGILAREQARPPASGDEHLGEF